MATGRQPSSSTIIGIAVLLFGAVLIGYGMHRLVATGTCSSTGYSANFGPVPHCPKGTGWWILFLIGGIVLVLVGGLVARGTTGATLIIPAIFSAIGVGSLTVAFQSGVSSSTKTFSLIFGGAFALCGLIPAAVIIVGALGKLRRGADAAPRPAPMSPATSSAFGAASSTSVASAFGATATKPDAIMGAYTGGTDGVAGATASGTPSAAAIPRLGQPVTGFARPPAEDPLDRIAKLSDLHDKGALTDDEFNREKAKLLGEL